MAKLRLTEEEFNKLIQKINMSPHLIEITRKAIVDGVPQKKLAKENNMSEANISSAVKRIKNANLKGYVIPKGYKRITIIIPQSQVKKIRELEEQSNLEMQGYETITAILPKHQAYLVKKWDKETKEKLRRTIKN